MYHLGIRAFVHTHTHARTHVRTHNSTQSIYKMSKEDTPLICEGRSLRELEERLRRGEVSPDFEIRSLRELDERLNHVQLPFVIKISKAEKEVSDFSCFTTPAAILIILRTHVAKRDTAKRIIYVEGVHDTIFRLSYGEIIDADIMFYKIERSGKRVQVEKPVESEVAKPTLYFDWDRGAWDSKDAFDARVAYLDELLGMSSNELSSYIIHYVSATGDRNQDFFYSASRKTDVRKVHKTDPLQWSYWYNDEVLRHYKTNVMAKITDPAQIEKRKAEYEAKRKRENELQVEYTNAVAKLDTAERGRYRYYYCNATGDASLKSFPLARWITRNAPYLKTIDPFWTPQEEYRNDELLRIWHESVKNAKKA